MATELRIRSQVVQHGISSKSSTRLYVWWRRSSKLSVSRTTDRRDQGTVDVMTHGRASDMVVEIQNVGLYGREARINKSASLGCIASATLMCLGGGGVCDWHHPNFFITFAMLWP